MPEHSISLAVGKLVNFSCRSGDLSHANIAGPSALEGQQAHKALQALKKDSQQAEVTIRAELEIDNYNVRLNGRIDLLDDSGLRPIISEIKSCYAPPEVLPESTTALHRAQLMVYGYCFLVSKGIVDDDAEIDLQLIWFNIRANQQTHQRSTEKFSTLQRFTERAVSQYVRWQQLVDEKKAVNRNSAKTLKFPFDTFRNGQRKMAAGVYCTSRDRTQLLLEAPTGIGKTISALFAGNKSMGENHIDRLVYLTAKNSGREAAGLAIAQLQNVGLQLLAATITAKKTTCHCSTGEIERADDGSCPMTIGFFDRLPAAREKLLQCGVISPAQLKECAEEFQLCPFELIQQILPWMDIIVCDYNYVFDPLVRLAFFDDDKARALILIDEAHNLVERARSMYSAQLQRGQIRHTINDLSSEQVLLKRDLKRLDNALLQWSKNCPVGESAVAEPPTPVLTAVNRCIDAIQNAIEEQAFFNETLAELSRELYRYSTIAELYGDLHQTITNVPSQNTGRSRYVEVQLTLRCLDAASHLTRLLKSHHSAVAFSATLRPLDYYRISLGLSEHTPALSLQSPFAAAQQATIIYSALDTRFKYRAQSVPAIVELLHTCLSIQPGNYQVFFPSYAYLQIVYDAFVTTHPNVAVIRQQRDSSEQQRKEYLASFENSDNLLAFSILGGIYGEGVDYVGSKLIGCVVVGTGLPAISTELQLLEQYHSTNHRNGFDFASRYPGLTRVLQTAGRVIRTETDRGIVILADRRFDQPFYRHLLPEHWQPIRCTNITSLQQELEHFWEQQKN